MITNAKLNLEKLIIYNSIGQIVKVLNLNKHDNQLTIDLSGFSDGLYLVSVIAKNSEVINCRIVKE